MSEEKQKLVMTHVDGGEYELLGIAKGAGSSKGMDAVFVYRSNDGQMWFRHDPIEMLTRFVIRSVLA